MGGEVVNWAPRWWNDLSTPQRWLVLGVLKIILLGLAIYAALHMKGLV